MIKDDFQITKAFLSPGHLSATPNIPSKSDFLESGGTNGKREKPGREEDISPQKNTQGQQQNYQALRDYWGKTSPEHTMTVEQERAPSGGERTVFH